MIRLIMAAILGIYCVTEIFSRIRDSLATGFIEKAVQLLQSRPIIQYITPQTAPASVP